MAHRTPAEWVNPLIDTANRRFFFFSSACRPFGMLNLSPDTARSGAWEAGYRYRMTYSTSCPSGTGVHSEKPQLYNTGFSGNYRYPRSGYYQIPTDELWWLGWNNNQTYEDVYYYARYRCSTSFATSPYSSNRTTKIDVRCAPHRRTFNTYPRCDTYGQDWQAMPYGP